MERLLRHGCEVRAFVRYNARNDIGYLAAIPPAQRDGLNVVAGDLRDGDAVRQAMKGVDIVFHLGALVSIPYSYHHPREVVDTNIMGTLNILMAVRDLGISKLIHTSTSEVYGTARYVPIDEEHPLQGQSPYSASKIGADKLVESFHAAYDLNVTTVRPFNVYGPRQSARAVIPTIITQLLMGSELKLGDTTPTRDFTFVEDTVSGFVSVAESDAGIGGVFNVGSNFEISIGELAQKIAGIIGREIHLVTENERLRPEISEVRRLWAENRRMRDVFGWRPTVSFEEGLGRTIDWIRSNSDHYQAGQHVV